MKKDFPFRVLGALTALAAGCADAGSPGTSAVPGTEAIAETCSADGDEDCVEVAAGALILDEAEDGRNGITTFRLVDADTIEVGGASRLAVGTPFMRAVRGHGLVIGRVTAAEDLGDGSKRFTFERARIQDVIPKVRLRTRRRVTCVEGAGDAEALACTVTALSPGPAWGSPGWRMAQPPAPLAIDTRESPLGVSDCRRSWINDASNLELELTSCHFTVSFDVAINLSWGVFLPTSFSTYVSIVQDAGLNLYGHFEDGFSAGGPDDEVTLGTLGPLTFQAGVIPMYVSGRFMAGYELDVHAEADFEAGFEYDGTDVFGFGWNKGDGVYKIRDTSRDWTSNDPTWAVAGDVEARAYIRPVIEAGVGIDGILSAGATISAELGARLDASVHADGDDAEACLSVDLYAVPTLGYDLDIFYVLDQHDDFALADYSTSLFNACQSSDERSDPECETGACDSDADCVYTAGAVVEGAPRGAPLGPKAGACVTGSCDREGSACACRLTWTPGCCVVGSHCGEGELCMTGLNRCMATGLSDIAESGGLEVHAFSCSEDADCDDERPLTSDSCTDGDCIHEFTGTTRPDAFACGRDSECGEGAFCSGGACLTPRIDPCAIKSCNDGNPRTKDTCANGTCSHTNLSILTGAAP